MRTGLTAAIGVRNISLGTLTEDGLFHFVDRLAAAAFLLPAGAIAFYYVLDVLLPKAEPAYALHNQILQGTAPSPYVYRVLAPWLIEWIYEGAARRVLQNGPPAFVLAEGLFAFAALWVSFTAVYRFIRRHHTPVVALAGQGILTFSIHTALRDHYYQPWSLLEPAVFAMALPMIQADRLVPLAILTAVATFNRETACFLVAIYGLYHGSDWRRRMPQLAALAGVWGLCYGGLRWYIGYQPHVIGLADVIDFNLRPARLAHTASAWVLFFGIFWLFFAAGLPWIDRRWRRSLAAFVLFLSVCLWTTCWWETRVWTSFLSLLLLPVCASLERWAAAQPRAG